MTRRDKTRVETGNQATEEFETGRSTRAAPCGTMRDEMHPEDNESRRHSRQRTPYSPSNRPPPSNKIETRRPASPQLTNRRGRPGARAAQCVRANSVPNRTDFTEHDLPLSQSNYRGNQPNGPRTDSAVLDPATTQRPFYERNIQLRRSARVSETAELMHVWRARVL